jgi:hypothetical protein
MPQPSVHLSGAPTEIKFTAGQLPSGAAATIPIYLFGQLDQFTLPTLRAKARSLAETIGAASLPPAPSQRDELIAWVIDVQIRAAAAAGHAYVTPRALGVPDGWVPSDLLSYSTQGHFGGDGALSASQQWALQGGEITLDKLQPNHRGLSYDENAWVNQQEAAHGYQESRLRNMGGSFAGGRAYGR